VSVVVIPVMTVPMVPAVLTPFVLAPLMFTPAVAPPATAVAIVIDNRRFAALHDDRGRSLNDHRWGRVAFDHDGPGCGVDRGRDDSGADEAADDTADKSAERGVTGVVAVGEGPQGECREGCAGAESENPLFHGRHLLKDVRCFSEFVCLRASRLQVTALTLNER
jgi:hypothetical protein